MVKSELILYVAKQYPQLTPEQAEKVVNIFFEQIAQSLIHNKRAEFRGFGSFYTRHRAAYQGRNPRTGEKVMVPAKRLPTFRPSKLLHKLLNNKI